MTAAQIVAIRAPSVVIDARVTNMITLAAGQIGPVFGDFQNEATALLTLHWLALETRGESAAAGAITSEKEGDLARSYGGVSGRTFGDLDSTAWGLQLKRLRDGLIFAARNRTI